MRAHPPNKPLPLVHQQALAAVKPLADILCPNTSYEMSIIEPSTSPPVRKESEYVLAIEFNKAAHIKSRVEIGENSTFLALKRIKSIFKPIRELKEFWWQDVDFLGRKHTRYLSV
ncbi:hypothetical protein L873DRAFT_1786532 [Choiromyces venosus 120613-1]|uniref:Uncharacterized protein n=1 Tax=Choiromyces venosus 120613-1 TaxID=1336337 RepID=A0A3N4K123_9PEZI|nr:hypothetical protein L873DRAFT_1786532 [Choiromyces venosus 120613-1]